MIARELANECTILIPQESHADLAAQFASHWGNERFARLNPYESMVFATTYHDSQFREVEADLPLDLDAGRPHGHRSMPFSTAHLDALRATIKWVASRDPYAALLISMHHTGLPQNRYGVIGSWQNAYGTKAPQRPMRPELESTVRDLENSQRETIQDLCRRNSSVEEEIRFNYRLLQVFDLLSLFLCCDGYENGGLKKEKITGVPLAFGSDEEVDLHLIPVDGNTLRIDPYPFDVAPIKFSVLGRLVATLTGHSETECREEYHKGRREPLSWAITN